MKKLILVIAAIAISAGVYAQVDSTKVSPKDMNKTQEQNLQKNPQDLNNKTQNTQNDPMNVKTPNQNVQSNPVDKSNPDGVVMQNGKVMIVKNGQTTIVDKDMTLSNGTIVMSDGTCIKKDGSKSIMKEGQHMDMSGKMIPMKMNKDKNTNTVPDSTMKKVK